MKRISLHSKKHPELYMICDKVDFNLPNQYIRCPIKVELFFMLRPLFKVKHSNLIGCFNTPKEDYSAYCEAEKKLFGEFAHE